MLAKCSRPFYRLALITSPNFVARFLRNIPGTTTAIRPPSDGLGFYLDYQTFTRVDVLPLGKFCASAVAPSLERRYFDLDQHMLAGPLWRHCISGEASPADSPAPESLKAPDRTPCGSA